MTRQAQGHGQLRRHVLSREDSDAIHAYVIERAHAAEGWQEAFLRWVGRNVCVPVSWVVD